MSKRISMAHGDGGELAHQLIRDVFIKHFGHQQEPMMDAVTFSSSGLVAVSTDSFVIKPIFFPGGNIGKLAVAGTVNDIAVSGAIPKYLTAGFIIEEGFLLHDLNTIVESMAKEAEKAGVKIIAGDTKVVEHGKADGLYINTTGVGFHCEEISLSPQGIEESDSVIVSGTIGDHGIAILTSRGELGLMTDIQSDCASLNNMIEETCRGVKGIRIMRDPTRGGLATTLVEICEDFKVTIELEESSLPVRREVKGACDMLGFDPLYLANEGKAVLIVAKEDEERVLKALHNHEYGKEAKVIGKVIGRGKGNLFLKTPLGNTRRLSRLTGMHLPRIC
ncbi:hydrogenase expression/formation protein HypE [Microaerobacter geothermalis]|uniref:hydrogenase expression/formation protein HypE n=1 Tax=Microaerobacter geothermalis TaxID=674972 RepID=UPI001F39E3F5|nr:hydrogenase expression/formation protein HypE [Microaerobacter geothermalis]MCF6092742.1 hydrogenase expression/formation protein HypE [Microaerobacter geothermalis]